MDGWMDKQLFSVSKHLYNIKLEPFSVILTDPVPGCRLLLVGGLLYCRR